MESALARMNANWQAIPPVKKVRVSQADPNPVRVCQHVSVFSYLEKVNMQIHFKCLFH